MVDSRSKITNDVALHKTSDTDEFAKKYPGVELAYPLAVASYPVAQKRFDAMNDRLQTLMTFGVSISLAIPVIGASRGLRFRSAWFVAAAICFVLATVIGGATRLWGSLKQIHPRNLYENWLELSELDFKKEFIQESGKEFEENKIAIERKGRFANITFLMFILCLCLAATWAASS